MDGLVWVLFWEAAPVVLCISFSFSTTCTVLIISIIYYILCLPKKKKQRVIIMHCVWYFLAFLISIYYSILMTLQNKWPLENMNDEYVNQHVTPDGPRQVVCDMTCLLLTTFIVCQWRIMITNHTKIMESRKCDFVICYQ